MSLYDNPDVIELTYFTKQIDQYLLGKGYDAKEIDSAKRNLKRKIESSGANGFRFKNIGRALLIYPDSLTVDALVEKYSQIKTKPKTMKSPSHEEKTVIQAGQIIRKQIKNKTDNLNWPPCYNDLTKY